MKKKKYVSPELTVVSFRTEVGYAASSNPVDNVAATINNTFELGTAGFQIEQEVGGQSTTQDGDEGIAAGYFYEENTTGWFSE